MTDFAALISRRVGHLDDQNPAPTGLGEAPAAPVKPAAKASSSVVPSADGSTEAVLPATSSWPAAPVPTTAGQDRVALFLQQVVREGRDKIVGERIAELLR